MEEQRINPGVRREGDLTLIMASCSSGRYDEHRVLASSGRSRRNEYASVKFELTEQ